VNTRCSPGRILGDHSKDQGANLFADTLPPSYSGIEQGFVCIGHGSQDSDEARTTFVFLVLLLVMNLFSPAVILLAETAHKRV